MAAYLDMTNKPIPTDKQLIDHVFRHDDFQVDIDAVVSRGEDPGAYVQCWVWVDFNDVEGFERIDYYETD